VLHEEIDSLPERYRVPIVLCDLQGSTSEEAARYMGSPVGTVKSLRARGRKKLRDRLAQRGITTLEGFVFPVPPINVATTVPSALSESTMRVAMARASSRLVSASIELLVEKTLRTMMMEKIKLLAYGFLSVAALAVGASALPGREPRSNSSKALEPPAVTLQSPGDPDPDDPLWPRPTSKGCKESGPGPPPRPRAM
jgi:RNA polymerase sigma-70 factor (ECF subfamily)